MGTNWKTCYHSDNYLISDTGKVYNKVKSNIVKQQMTSDGYLSVTLSVFKGKRKTFKVHRLVSECFIPNIHNKETVNHNDGIKTNNHVSNLSWMTRSENIQHAWDNGLIKDLESRKAGIRSKQGKPVLCTTTGEVFSSIGEAAEEKGLKKSNISAVCLGKVGFKSAGKTENGEKLLWRFLND